MLDIEFTSIDEGIGKLASLIGSDLERMTLGQIEACFQLRDKLLKAGVDKAGISYIFHLFEVKMRRAFPGMWEIVQSRHINWLTAGADREEVSAIIGNGMTGLG